MTTMLNLLKARLWQLRRRLLKRRRTAPSRAPEQEEALRMRLLYGEQIELRGKALARSHRLQTGRQRDRLLARLRDNEVLIDSTCELLTQVVRDDLQITPAGEWLLDNHYLIQEQVRTARRHLPPGYSRELPALSRGPSAQLPRVYDLAIDAISHTDGRIDAEALSRFFAAYQSITPLKLGELWAIPIMLRLALIENLRRMSSRVMSVGIDRRLASEWASRFQNAAELSPKDIVLVVADLARSSPPLSGAFVAQLTRGLHGRNPALAMPMSWIDQWLADAGHTVESLVHAESRQQAVDQVSISNSIVSLRFLSNMDWREFVETLSAVEQTLREDPAGTYVRMDFATRDSYRHAVERMARQTGVSELDVAGVVLRLARAAEASADSIKRHVGYYLIDAGLAQTKPALAKAGIAGGIRWRPLRPHLRRLPLPLYLLPIATIAASFTATLYAQLPSHIADGPLPWLVIALGLIAFSELGIALINWAATRLVVPQPLPRLDYSKGIPSIARTLIVVPSMLSNSTALSALLEGLEVRFLGNREEHLHFALLTDFLDAKHQHLPTDAALLTQAEEGIAALNARYSEGQGDLFFLFHRGRQWNPRERVWMSVERKRGKLAALNRLLRSATHEDALAEFDRVIGDTRPLLNVRYVITLDTDTVLPRDAARELVATLAHPLNRARFDDRLRKVRRGYGILQPSIGTFAGAGALTRYQQLIGGTPGIDPYSRTISDVYQDLFGEGSFFGKGIYDVDAFEHALQDRLPENRILSHDLLEGCYARAGLVSDVWLYEQTPSRYASDVSRRSRWIRGDWQLLLWLLPWVPRAGGGFERNPLSMLSRGKLLDNLRRSLVSAALTALLLIGWVLLDAPLLWTLLLLGVPLLPVLLPALPALFEKPVDMALHPHVVQIGSTTLRRLYGALMGVSCLCFDAWYSLVAAARSLWRISLSRRRLLQWNPSSEVERHLYSANRAELRRMWFSPLCALLGAALVFQLNPSALLVAGPVLGLWLIAPALMSWLGQAPPHWRAPLAASDVDFLGRLARRTWGFFETQVRARDHSLPPDNVQEHPAWLVAHRTSPTNIGLSLLANLAARDFGYLQTRGLIERTAAVFETLDRLPRHRGHFYNWYDTETLQPLQPLYISTVDSGNLAGHLLTLRQGLLGLIDAPILAEATLQGLADTFGVLEDARSRQFGDTEQVPALLDEAITAFRLRLQQARAEPPQGVDDSAQLLEQLGALAAAITASWPAPVESGEEDLELHWPQALQQACDDARAELLEFAPASAGAEVDRVDAADPAATSLPSLRALSAPSNSAPASQRAREQMLALERLAHRAGQFALMEYDFLYDRSRRLLAIGYKVDERQLDPGLYDLLASEARLCSFVAIAQGKLPQESWFALGRLLTEIEGKPTLLSWSGSMFEYLMPQLVMPSYPNTLLDQTARHAVNAQILYAQRRGLPWGISESGYNARDARLNYQYRAFGVPGLGLKRGLSEDLVIAPYASMMALMVDPAEACRNLQRLSAEGFEGRLGLHEAIDYTPGRVPLGHTHAVVRSHMAHHQGMGLLALDYLLHDQPMQKRFCADPEIQATLLLLQERIPKAGFFHPHQAEANEARANPKISETQLRVIRDPNRSYPDVQLLSNGHYHSLLSSAGGGYNRARDMAITRWREDATRDHWGSFCYLRDVASGAFWSATYQPTCREFDHYEAIFSDAKAEFRTRLHEIETHLEVAVSPEDNIELRRLHLRNRSRRPRLLEITTYAEVALTQPLADELHPAFSNLFVQTEILASKQALLCTRRARSSEETPPWMLHLLAARDTELKAISYETDRNEFLGRGCTPRNPRALTESETLSCSAGSVLDPIVAIRCRLLLQPEQTAVLDMVTGVGNDREACVELIDKYRDRPLADRAFELAFTHSQVVRQQINASQPEAQLYERLAGLMVFASPLLRAEPAVLLQNRRGQSGLWRHGISGDLPIVLVQIADIAHIELVRQMVQAHAYWRLKGLQVDLVIWNEDQAGYRQLLQDQILALVSAGPEGNVLDKPGGIFVRPVHQISQEERILLQAVARVVVSDRHGTLSAQMDRRPPLERTPAELRGGTATTDTGTEQRDLAAEHASPRLAPDLEAAFAPPAEPFVFDNSLGAFAADGCEYVIQLREGEPTPAPWCNVLANADFGCVLSESSPGYTWFENAHMFRLTPWHNDPVTDSGGEAFYLRDEDSGMAWSPMPLPRRGQGEYRTRHGFGYSVYSHEQNGIATELWVFVAHNDAIKFSLLKVHNRSGRTRRLSAFGYVEWVLGDLRSRTQMHLCSDLDPGSAALRVQNHYSDSQASRVAFFDADGEHRSFTADRREFLGRNGSPENPAALRRERLSGRLGVGLDPCAAIQIPFVLHAEESFETCFRLGVGVDARDASALALRSQGSTAAHLALRDVRAHWRRTLGVVQVSTPDPSLDLLANGWLLYQTLASRCLGRSGYYQSGGAFGFRDQLQDTMATLHAQPALTREHLLRSAAKQFVEGDVLHWWHPPQGRGVRTQCSDDYLWLPLATCRYLSVSADRSVLDEAVGFVEGRPLSADEESYYDLPLVSGLHLSLYQHCVRALQRGISRLGAKGLPLIGCGDWNDGMNRVGFAGRGESVWLGFFLFDVLGQFAEVARGRGDLAFANDCSQAAEQLRGNLEKHAWDGQWFRRAWYDDGTPLGSASSDECRIDSISQSWSVLSGAASPTRARQAMQALHEHLVRPEAGLVQLLDPPFDRTRRDPGYIRGYVPGVRENGGQYTHAAVWAAMAFARLGDRERAWQLARMINPIQHSLSAEDAATYRVEPYVLAADVYAVAPHIGRGGWTWYTGSASWMYRLLTESLLGLSREGAHLVLRPCIPADWDEYRIDYRFGSSLYRIHLLQMDAEELKERRARPASSAGPTVENLADGGGYRFALRDDGVEHPVELWLLRP